MDAAGRLHRNSKIINSLFFNFYSELQRDDISHSSKQINISPKNPGPLVLCAAKIIYLSPPTKSEQTIKELCVTTGPGPEGFMTDWYKSLLDILTSLLTEALNKANTTGRLPNSTSLATIAPIHKPGRDPQVCAN